MLTNVIRYADGRYPYAAGAAMEPGDVVVRPCGTLALFDGMYGAASGELVNPQPLVPTQIAEMKTASGTTWSAGATFVLGCSCETGNQRQHEQHSYRIGNYCEDQRPDYTLGQPHTSLVVLYWNASSISI